MNNGAIGLWVAALGSVLGVIVIIWAALADLNRRLNEMAVKLACERARRRQLQRRVDAFMPEEDLPLAEIAEDPEDWWRTNGEPPNYQGEESC